MSDATQPAGNSQPQFRKELTLFDCTMIVVGSMIGSGIFIVSADIARTVGGGGWLLVVWLISGLMTMAAALTFGELAAMMPKAGGQYVFLREAWGALPGFLYGWTLFMVIQCGSIAAVAVAFAKFTSVLIPWFSEKDVLVTVAGLNISAAQLLAIASIVLLTWVNLRGLRQGKLVQNLFTSTKAIALLGLIVVVLVAGKAGTIASDNVSSAWSASWTRVAEDGVSTTREPVTGLMLLVALGVSMVGSLFASDSWNDVTYAAAEVKRPQRDIPLSLALGTGTVTLLYLLANVAYLSVLPAVGHPDAADVVGRGVQFATNDRVGTAAVSAIFGTGAEVAMALLVMISTFGCNNGLILSGARVYYAMACDGLFFARAGQLNRNAVPGAALVMQGVWASLLCLSGRYGDLLDYVIFAALLFGMATVGAVFALRIKRPEMERPYRTWGYPFVPAFYIIFAAAVSFDLLLFKPSYTWPGLLIVLLGVPVYFAWRAVKHRAAA